MKDACLRSAVRSLLSKRHSAESDVVIVDELPAERASTRIDIAVLNGHLHGIELKSDSDTLERLPRQVLAFSAAMQQMTLVVGSRHVAKAVDLVPDWWAVVEARTTAHGHPRLATLKRGRRNRKACPMAMGQLLERDELLAVLHRHGRDRGVRTRPYAEIIARVVGEIPASVLADEIRAELKFRARWEASNETTAFGRSVLDLNPLPVPFMPVGPAASYAGSPEPRPKVPAS